MPAGLEPGDTFQLVFVTSTQRDPNSPLIDDYNQFVQSAANAAGIGDTVGITWKAIGSTAAVDARDNAFVSAPVYRLDGVQVATSFDDLWDGVLSNPINLTETGSFLTTIPYSGQGSTWTGTDTSGSATVYPLGSGWNVTVGKSDKVDWKWIAGSVWNSDHLHFYSLSAVLTVPLPAIIDLEPNTLNLKSKGKWITCYIELPDDYDVAEIDVSTVMLETIPAEDSPTEVGDYDDDGISDLMVKFDRQALIQYLDGATGDITLTVTGELTDGTPFEGSDTIRVIKKGK